MLVNHSFSIMLLQRFAGVLEFSTAPGLIAGSEKQFGGCPDKTVFLRVCTCTASGPALRRCHQHYARVQNPVRRFRSNC